MSIAKIPLIAMHNYTDGEIWKNAVFPEGFDKNYFINTVLLEYGELETLYADPQFMQFAIGSWSEINYWGIQRAVAAQAVKYEPLENYDRTESRTREYSDNVIGTNTGTVQDAGTNTGTVANTGTVGTSTSGSNTISETDEHTVSAYDSSTYSSDNKDTIAKTETTSAQGTTTNNLTRTDNLANSNTRTDNLQDTRDTTGAETETIRAHGNIGVTSSQDMLRQELDIALYNVYRTYAGVFATNLLLMVY